jgi:hypothetical protein
MNWTRLHALAALSSALIASPATAYADEPVPTVDQVVAIMAELTDPGRPAASKTDIVTPGFAPDEAGTIDDHLNILNGRGYIPFHFVVTDIQPAPGGTAGATVAAPHDFPYWSVYPCPIVLVNQSGHWMIVHDAAMVWLNAMRSNTRHRDYAF